jgi:hypothetical protein
MVSLLVQEYILASDAHFLESDVIAAVWLLVCFHMYCWFQQTSLLTMYK